MKKKYLIHLDMLGFEDLPTEIGMDKGIKSSEVRKNLKNTINNRIEEAKKKIELTSIEEAESGDSWLIAVDTLENVFLTLSIILQHDTGYIGYEKVPLEIAIGIKEYDKEVDESTLFYQDETIDYLKSGLIRDYKSWYKSKNNHKSVKETFIVTDNLFFKELPVHYRDECDPINSNVYFLPESLVERESKMMAFFKKIGQERVNLSGALIDRLFIPPEGYDEIKKTLEENKIVFIKGAPGYGKTYTAVRLLWEYHEKGYTPRWISGKEEEERKNVRDKLANIEAELKPGHVIYFEDPFGKTKYEKRDDLKERINHIINLVKDKEDVFVILTSRKDVFEEFERESYSVEEISEFEQELDIIQPSYDLDKRKEILKKWATQKGCRWIEKKEFEDFIFESMNKDGTLVTPLSIYDFVTATTKTTNLNEIKEKIVKYSESTTQAFADEIKGLYDSGREDRILLLSLISILESRSIDFIKNEYNKMKKDNYEDFEEVLKEESRVKRVGDFDDEFFDSKFFDTGNYLTFAHPSYSESIRYVLKHPGCRTIFSKVLVDLSEIKEETIVSSVSWAIASNYDKLPEESKELLFKYSENPNPKEDDIDIGDIAEAIMYHYDKLPEEVRKLLFKFAEMDPGRIAFSIDRYFYKLPNDIRNKLLLHIYQNSKNVKDELMPIFLRYFDELPDELRELYIGAFEMSDYEQLINLRVPANVWMSIAKGNGLSVSIGDISADSDDPKQLSSLIWIINELTIQGYQIQEDFCISGAS